MPRKQSTGSGSGAAHSPTRVLIGHWVHSSEPDPDQHAVYGILSSDDKLRFKLVPETRDGRPVQGNYPPSRETWVIHEDIAFEPYLERLNRLGMKEYCRARGRQVDDAAAARETAAAAAANILLAVETAERISTTASNERPRNLRWEREKCADRRRAARKEGWAVARATNGRAGSGGGGGGGGGGGHGRHAAEEEEGGGDGVGGASVLGATPAEAGAGVGKNNSIRRRKHGERRTVYNRDPKTHISAEAVAAAAAAAAATTTTTATGAENGGTPVLADSSRGSMEVSTVDVSTPSSATDSSADDTRPKVYNDVVYRRSQTGPFAGKFMTRGRIVSIDGDDYVEYRVLAKV